MPVVSLDRLTFGGDAIGRLDGKAVFVPFGAPGDEADVTIDADHPRWARAHLDTLRRPGPGRTAPPCSFFGTCGGCQWQHLDLAAQRDAKHAIVTEQLTRIGGIDAPDVAPVIPTPPWGYRDRVTLAVHEGKVGFLRGRSHAVVPVDTCAIASPAIEANLGAARAVAARLGPAVAKISIVDAGGSVVLVIELQRGVADGRTLVTAACEAWPDVQGVVLAGGGRRATVGDVEVSRRLEPGLDLRVPADTFTQVSAAAYETLVTTSVQLARVRAGTTVLDLFAGAGTLGLPLARRGALVHGVERDRRAVRAARAAARQHGIETFRIVASDVAAALRERREGVIDLAVIDPPRRGAAACLPPLMAHRPARILYVSCDPATFARDVRTLVSGGYRLGRVHPIDLFPQTFHVEMVAELRLT